MYVFLTRREDPAVKIQLVIIYGWKILLRFYERHCRDELSLLLLVSDFTSLFLKDRLPEHKLLLPDFSQGFGETIPLSLVLKGY